MAGLTWFELDVDMPDDPKCVALGVRLKNPLAFGYMVRIYAYCYRHCTDTFSGPGAPCAVEAAARWRGRTGALFAALLAEGFIDRRERDSFVVHGVLDRLAPHLVKMERDRTRAKERRHKAAQALDNPSGVRATPARRPRDVAGDSNSNSDQTSAPTEQVVAAATPADPNPWPHAGGRDPASGPLLNEFRSKLSTALAVTSGLKIAAPARIAQVRQVLEAELERLGVDHAVEACAEYARARSQTPGWLSYFVGFLQDMPTPGPAAPDAPPSAPAKGSSSDMSWSVVFEN